MFNTEVTSLDSSVVVYQFAILVKFHVMCPKVIWNNTYIGALANFLRTYTVKAVCTVELRLSFS